ncbi:DUF11 domain-containing protein [Salinibacterium sp. NK8237]|uniref:DUF7507 domain-containing protein n=1 Tax=Salinibacterium sp. NK8237 TaxID=2792038 RepID=UPI0018CD8EBE|nr:DUF11 domain-containing protein [Salinibacterium sp. NK8237]MBH0130282.1 DUF11 domain-containing protein [Salinibacterium sp. NK8237]
MRHNSINVERTQRSARSTFMRGVASVVAFGLLVAGLTVMPSDPAEAAVVQWGTNAGTSPSYQTTVNGDFLMAGNGVLACNRPLYTAAQIGTCADLHSASGGNGNTANDNFYLENSNTVAGFTTNSSSANITIPAGASVKKAFLSWSANTGVFTGTTANACTTVNATRGTALMPAGSATGYRTAPAKLKVGTGAVTTVAPTTMLEDPVGTTSAIYYSASADVTTAFAGALTGTPLTISAGDLWAPQGAGCYAGWTLTVVYDYGVYIPSNLNSAPHRIIFYEGHVRMTAAEAPLTVAFNGFSAIATGTRAGFSLYEGDRIIQGDIAEYSRGNGAYTQLANSAGNTGNIGIGRGEGSVRYTALTDTGPFTNQSVDVATVDLPNVQAGDTSVNLRMSTSGDSYLLQNAILSVPSAGINVSKTYDGTLDQQSRTATEPATFTITVTNSGVGILQNIVIADDQTDCARTLTGVTLAPLESYTYTCVANGPTTASYDSTATATASTVVGASPATGSDSTRVLLSSLTLAKTSALAGGATGRAGDTLNYTFTIKNNGDSPLTGVAVTDPMTGLSALTYTWPTATAGALAAGASATATATYTLTQADVDAGSIANTASATGTDADGGVKPVATANRTTPIPVNAVLETKKTAAYAGTGVGNVGDTVNYSFSVKNTGNVTLTSVTLTDPLTGLSAIAVTWPGTSGTLAPGQTATGTATYTVKQADVNAGKIVNQATSAGRTPKNVAVTGLSNEVTLATAPAAPALTTTKSGTVAEPKGVGSVVTYNFSAKNTGNVTLTGVVIADPLVGLSALTYSWPGTAGTLAPGQTVTATATYTVKQSDVDAGLVRNTATSSGTSPSGTAVTAASPRVDVPLQTRTPAISLTKSGALAGGSTAGSTVNYSFVLTNSGNVTLTNAGITDPLSGLSAITYGTWPGTVGTLAPGQSVTATATYTVKQSDVDAGAIANSATAKGTPPTGADVTRTTPATVPITADAKMVVTKSGTYTTGSGAVGSVVTYTFSVKNDGNVTLSQVVLADPLSGLSSISVTWPGASGVLTPGQTATGTATYTVKQSDVDAGSVKNTATATAKTPAGGTVTQPSVESVVPTVAPTRVITTTKSALVAGGATGKVGDVINYSFSAKNDGNVTLTGVTIADPHVGLSTLTYTWPGATGVLAPGQTVTAVATYTIKQSDVDAGSVKNIATGSGTHAGTTVSNPSAEITVPTVAANPVVTTLKSGALAAGSTGRAGDTVNFSIKLTNSGNVTLTSVSAADTLPDLSALTYGTWPSGTAGTLAPGQSVTATATYTLKQTDVDAGSVANTATGTGTPPIGAAVTSTSPATVPITAGPALTVAKSGAVTSGNGSVGDTVTFSFVVRNTGNVTATGVGITDSLVGLSAVTFGTWPSGTAGTLAPNTQVTATATYLIKQADVNAGSVKNTATASGSTPSGGTVTATSPQAVVPTVASSPAITTQKSASVAGTGAVGDVITYTFIAKNTGNVTLTGVSIADPLTGLSALTYGTWPGGVTGTLAPNAQVTATATYTIAQSDVDAGSVKNTATSTGSFGGATVNGPSPQVTTPTVASVRTISLAKDGALAAGATGVAGDTVNYSFVVRNTGNVTLTSVGITDPLPGLSAVTFGTWPSGTAGRLLPNTQVTATATYVLKQSDVDAGSVANTATTRGTPPTGAAVSATAPATVPVAANGALAVAKTGAVTSGTGGVGSTMTFSFSITNPGNVTMTGVAIADSLVGLSAPVYTWPTATAGRIAPGETATATATYTVKQADVNAGSVANTATVSGKTPTNATVTSSPSTANVPTIAGAPELTTTKSANVTSGAKVGDSITYSIAISNTGNQTITGVTLTDSLVGLSTPVVTWPGVAGTLAPGQTATALASYTVKQSDVDAGSIANTASAAGTAPGATPVSDDSNPVVTTTATPAPTLSLVKSGTLPAGSTSVAGEVVTYSFVIRNTGNVTITGAAVADPLSGLSAITYGTWPSGTAGTLAPNTQVTATATYTVKQTDVDAGSIANTATATGTGVIGGAAAPKTSSATVPLASAAKLTVSKTGAVAAGANKVGDTVTFSFVVKNTGNVTLSSVGITDSLADLSAVTFGTWPGGTTGVLAPNAQVTATATYTIKQSDVNAGSVKNTATASGTPPSGPVATATSTQAVVPTVAAAPALVTTKSAVVGGTGTGAIGDTITYTFTARNTGNVTLTGVTLTDPLSGLSTPTYVWSGGVSGQLNPNGTVTGTATYTITQADVDAGSVKNIATATGTPPTGAVVTAPSPQLVTPTIASAPKIGVTKSGALAPGAQGVAGDVVTWSLTLTNSGNVTLTSVSVTDSLPGVSAVTYGTWPSTAGTLAPGQSVSATATYVLTQADIDAGAVSNTANGSGTPPRGSPATATAPATLPLASNSTITLDKTAAIVSPGTGVVGDTIRYTFTAQNTGNVTLTNVIIADPRPGLSALTYGTWTSGTVGRLAPGQTITATADYVIRQADQNAGVVNNTASVSGKPPAGANATASSAAVATPTATRVPGILTTKTSSVAGTGAVGDVITYTITVRNTGNTTLTSVSASDPLSGLSTLTYGAWPGGVTGTLQPNTQVVATAKYTIKQSDVNTGSVTNTATGQGTSPSAGVITDPSDEVITPTVAANPAATFSKTGALAPGAVGRAGDVITYTFTTKNTGNVTLTGVGVTDPLPSLGAISYTWPGATGVLTPGQSVVATANYTVKQSDVDAGSVSNTATLTATPPSGTPFTETDPETVSITADPRIQVDKAATVTDREVDGVITFTMTIRNTGNQTLTAIDLDDSLVGLGPVSYSPWPDTDYVLAPGEQVVATADYTITQADIDAGGVQNTASVTGQSPQGVEAADTSETVTVSTAAIRPELTVVKSASTVAGPNVVGSTITYTFDVTNTGNVTVQDITLVDSMLAGATPTLPITSLAPGDPATSVSVDYVITQADVNAGSVINTVVANGATTAAPTEFFDSLSSSTTTVTEAARPSISVTKEGTATGQDAGDTVNWTFTVTNDGNVTLTGVALDDALAGVTPVFGSWPGATPNQLDPTESVTATGSSTLTQADVDAGSIINTVTASGTPTRGAVASATTAETVPLQPDAGISIVKAASVDVGEDGVGDTVTFTFTVTNTGNVTLDAVSIIDPLDGISAISYDDWDGSPAGSLAPNDVLTATATYTLTQADIDRGFVDNDSSALASTPAGDILDEDSNTATVTTEAATPALVTTKDAVLNGTGDVGDTISYTITLLNDGNVTLTDAEITDSLAGLSELVYGEWVSGVEGELAPNTSVTATANYTVTQADVDAGSVSNIATGDAESARDGAAVTDDSPAAVTPLVTQVAAISATKTGALESGSEGEAGDLIDFSFTITNDGNVTLTGVTLTDPLADLSAITYIWPTATDGVLAPGETATAVATYELKQSDVDSGSVVNLATPSGVDPNAVDVDGTEVAATVVVEPDAGLSAIKTGELRAGGIGQVGDIIDYSVTATNSGNVTLHEGQLLDPLPGISDPNIVWPDPAQPGVLGVGESVTGTAEYTLTQADIDLGYIENTAEVQALTPNDAVVPATTNTVVIPTVRPAPILTVDKTAVVADAGELGDEIAYSFTITNDGNVTIDGITLADPLPGLTDLTVNWDVANTTQTLAPGESVTATATYEITQDDVNAGEVRNTATASGTDAQGTAITGDSPEVVTEVVAAAPSLSATKSAALAAGATGVAGDTVEFSFTVTNDGNVSLTSVDLIDQLPGLTGVTFGAWPTATDGLLNPGDDVTATATYTLLQSDIDAGSLANSANAMGVPPTGSAVTQPASATLPLTATPDFTITKTGGLGTQLGEVGDVIDYSFSITNSGNVTLTGVVLIDSMPGVSTPVIVWPGDDRVLAPGETATATADYTITQDDVDAGSVSNTAEALGSTPDGTEYFEFSDPAIDPTVERTDSVTIDKVGSTPDGAAFGDLVHYDFTLQNTGNTTLNGVAIDDPLVGLSTIVYSWPGADGELAPGETATATATYAITQADIDRGYVRNSADVDATSPLGAVEDSVGPIDVLTDAAAPAIETTKNGALEAGSTGFAGDIIDYSFTVRNSGNVTLTGVTMTDPLTGLSALTYTWPTATDGMLAPGQSATAVATYELTQADVDAGKVDNTVTAEGTTPAAGTVDDTADETVTITPAPVLTPFKSGTILDGGVGAVGDTVQYTLTVTNDGNVTLYDGQLLDPLPGLSVPVITWPDSEKPGEIPVGESVIGIATYVITQADVDLGYIPNTADMSAQTPQGVVIVEASNEVIVPMVLPSPNITVTKSGAPQGSADFGDIIDYTFEILNSGNVTLDSVTLADPLPNLSAITITWPTPTSPGVLAPGEIATATADYEITQDDVDAGAVLNIATADGVDPNGTDVTDDSETNTVPTETIRAEVELTKSGVLSDPARADEGDTVNWSFELTNSGNVTLTGVEIVDTLPGLSALTYAWPDTAGTLEVGESVTATATSTLTQEQIDAGTVANDATGSGTPPRGDAVSDPATASVVLAPQAGMAVTKDGTVDGAGNAGDTIDYDFGITNTGNVTLTLVDLVDALVGVSSPVFTWPGTTGELQPGETVTATADYTITQDDVDRGSVSNVATASGKPPIGDTITVSTTVTETTVAPAAASLLLTKSSSTGASAGVNDIVTYTFEVENTGNVTVDEIVITDPLPGLSTPVVNWPGANGVLAPGEIATATATYAITQADVDAGTVDNTAVADGTSPTDAAVASNTALESTPTDAAAPDILVTKSGALAPGSTGFEGDLVEYEFSLTNNGNQTLTSVSLADPLPGLSALVYSWPTATAGTLVPGAVVTATATHELTQADIDSGSVANVVTGSATPPSGVAFEEDAPATVAIVANGELETTKWGVLRAGGIGQVGDWVDYRLEATNTGNVTLIDGELRDPLPGLSIPTITWPNPAQPGVILPGETVIGEASVQLTQEDIDRGYISNIADVGATDPNDDDVSATTNEVIVTTVQPQPSMTVVKSGEIALTGENGVGDSVDFEFEVRNTGNVTIGSIVVTDPLPGMSTPIVQWPTAVETLAPTEAVTATASYLIRQSDVDRGYVENTASATAVPVRGDPISATSNTVEVPTEAPSVVVSVTNVGALTNPGPAVEGDTVTWNYSFTSTSNVTLSGVELSDFLGSLPAGDYTWPGDVGVLAPGDTVTAVRVQTLTQADIDSGAVSSVVTGEGTPPVGAAATATAPATVALAADGLLQVTKSSELAVAGENGPGDTIDYTIVVTNIGNVTLRTVTITDSIDNVSINSIVWPANSGVLAPGESATASATYVLEQDDVDRGYVDNTASVRGVTPGGDPVTATSNVDRELTAVSDPSITAEKSGVMTSGSGEVGSEITYSFIVKNTGNVTLRLVGVLDPLIDVVPSDLTFPSATGILGPNEQAVGSVVYTVTQADVDSGTVENTATAIGTAPDGSEVQGVSNTVFNPTEDAEPSIVTSHTAALAAGATGVLGDGMDYTFTITNDGNVSLDGVTLSNMIPGLTGFVYTWPDAAAPGVLAPGESVTVTATRLVDQADIDAGEVRNVATGAGNSPAATAVDADSAVTVVPLIEALSSIDIAKAGEPRDAGNPVVVGSWIDYTFTVENTGETTLSGVTVADPKVGTTAVAYGTWPAADGVLAPGESVTATASYQVTQAEFDAGSASNTANVTSTNLAGDDVIDTSNTVVAPTAAGTPDIGITKTQVLAAGATGNAGDVVEYNFEVTNTGDVTLNGVTIADDQIDLSTLTITWPGTPGVLAPGESATATATYVLTQDDVDAGSISSDASTAGTPVVGAAVTDTTTGETPIAEDPSMAITKSSSFATLAQQGATVNYVIEVVNTGNVTLTAVSIDDPKPGVSALAYNWPGTPGELAPGESVTATATYVITQADVDVEQTVNVATVNADAPSGAITPEEATDVLAIPNVAAIDLTISGVLGAGQQGFPGDLVIFTYVATNTGTKPLTNVSINDPRLGLSAMNYGTWPGAIGVLLPGQSITATATYVIREGDAGATLYETATVTSTELDSGDPVVATAQTSLQLPNKALSYTGSDPRGTLATGLGTLLAGLALILLARRRQRQEES